MKQCLKVKSLKKIIFCCLVIGFCILQLRTNRPLKSTCWTFRERGERILQSPSELQLFCSLIYHFSYSIYKDFFTKLNFGQEGVKVYNKIIKIVTREVACWEDDQPLVHKSFYFIIPFEFKNPRRCWPSSNNRLP